MPEQSTNSLGAENVSSEVYLSTTSSTRTKQVPTHLSKVLLNEMFTRPAVQTTVYIVQWNHRPREKHRVQLKSLVSLEKIAGNQVEAQ